ncbi:hypothetical protein [Actinoplanes sp. NPDC051411]|uniref:hypothetical protein n=1 Tax=Actinoplanes sp. NPDC051411 TaxID=3155522 RepID=UPI00341317FE
MTNADQEDGGFPSGSPRRRRVILGATGLAAVLGVGALLATDRMTRDPGTTTAGPARPAALTARASVSASVPPSVPPSGAPSTSVPGPVKSPAAVPKAVKERADQARTANQRLGTEARHPLPSSTSTVDPGKVTVEQTGTDTGGHMLRVSSSRQDLTGYRELAWVRDGEPYGDATCTQTITVSPDVPPRKRPTLLICWRTSAARSVYTIAVDFAQHPSADQSVRARSWRR